MVQLFELLEKKSCSVLLKFFLQNPSQAFYQKQLKATGLAKASIIHALNSLAREGILKVEQKGRMKFYSLDNSSQIVRQIKIFYSVSSLTPLMKKFEEAEVYLYGSTARGEEDEKSDVDLLFIGSIDKKKVLRECEKISKNLKKNVKPIIFTQLEFSKLGKTDKAFYEKVVKERIKLV